MKITRAKQAKVHFAYFVQREQYGIIEKQLLSLCRALWRILRAKMENLACLLYTSDAADE